MDKTIDYYNKNAKKFFEETVGVDFDRQRERFMRELPKSARVLDLGCGSGRDSRAFLKRGFHVEAVDASEELCGMARAYTGLPVKNIRFDEIDAFESYNGIWACASLLHVPFDRLGALLRRLARALKRQGVLYASFKYGDFEGTCW